MKNSQGFLLLELSIVIVIVAILYGILAPKGVEVLKAANQTAKTLSVDGVESAMYIYYVNKARWPTVKQLNNSLKNKGTAESNGIVKGDIKVLTFEDINCTDKTDNTSSDKVRCVRGE